jgi:hypothetical protein
MRHKYLPPKVKTKEEPVKAEDYVPRCPAERYEGKKDGYLCWYKGKACTERDKPNLYGCSDYRSLKISEQKRNSFNGLERKSDKA